MRGVRERGKQARPPGKWSGEPLRKGHRLYRVHGQQVVLASEMTGDLHRMCNQTKVKNTANTGDRTMLTV